MELKKGDTPSLSKGYIITEVGVIPFDWEVKSLGQCLLKNPDYGINAAAVDYDDTLPTYLRITDISEDGKYLSSSKASVNNALANSYYLDKGDIVFARTGATTGKSYLVRNPPQAYRTYRVTHPPSHSFCQWQGIEFF